jgi:hypothetical protein
MGTDQFYDTGLGQGGAYAERGGPGSGQTFGQKKHGKPNFSPVGPMVEDINRRVYERNTDPNNNNYVNLEH